MTPATARKMNPAPELEVDVEETLQPPLSPPTSGREPPLGSAFGSASVPGVPSRTLESSFEVAPPLGSVDGPVVRGEGPTSEIAAIFEDSGPGIRTEHLREVFEPFFTTKREGTGLGLSLARQVVERHGGRIKAESGKPGDKASDQRGGTAVRTGTGGRGRGSTAPPCASRRVD